MPAVLTHKSIMLLARKRLEQIKEALEVKRLAGVVPRTNIETRVQDLATKALDMMSTDPHPSTDFPGVPYARPLGSDVSQFAVMGAMGPDIPAFAEALRPGQAWVFDNIHKGNPDQNREYVVAGTTDFIFAFWRKVSAAIVRDVPEVADATHPDNRDAQLKKMRAYVMGHLCHMAGDIISHPLINELEWRFATQSLNKLEHADGESSHDALVARKVLLRESTRAGAAWDAWWPPVDRVPPQFFAAYSETLEEIYSALSNRRTGFKEFEDVLTALNPPRPDADFIKDGYSLYRGGIVSMVYHYTTWNWFAFLLPVWGPLMTAPLLGGAFPLTRAFFIEKPEDVRDEDRWPGLLSLGLALGSAASLAYSIWIACLTKRGIDAQSTYGIVANAVSSLLGAAGLISMADTTFPTWARWAFFVAVPLATALVQLLLWLVHAAQHGHGRRSKLALALAAIMLAPLAGLLLAALLYWGLRGDDGKLEEGWFLLGAGIWLLVWGAIGLLIGWVLRDVNIPEEPKNFAETRQLVRLFDDATLYRDPSTGGAGLAEKFYPTARRKLLNIFWEGPGDLFVRLDRYRLVFSFVDHSTAADQVVPAPIAPMKLAEFIKELNRRVKGPGGEEKKLQAEFAYPGSLDYELPPGATFGDHGEEEENESRHLFEAAKFKKVSKDRDDPYVLFHAPKPAQSVRFSSLGPVDTLGKSESDLKTVGERTGYPYVFDELTSDGDESLMGYAADFAALLCMGAVTHLDATFAEPDKVYQVFRNWSLDRRRVNEWRMLVAGGAVSEKGGHPDQWDPTMLKPPDSAAWRSPMTGAPAVLEIAEQSALKLGWVTVMREWLNVARTPGLSAVAPDRMRPGAPTSIELSRGLAYILDLPEPA
ncbi:MAG TPA: zinc dependent phospholipase C family protein [Burkholderiales bacterium]|nr:zinc dependent phospholipase C family protein [Burkholderiales bacterium]